MTRRTIRTRGWGIPALFLLTGTGFAQTAITGIGENADPVGRYEEFELAFALGTVYDNPFDPDEADVRVRFMSPSGYVRTVIAFWSGNPFPTTATRDWKARFAPLETGT